MANIFNVFDEIPFYNGDGLGFAEYISTMDDLWSLLGNDNDKQTFITVARIRLSRDAKRAVMNGRYENWDLMKIALRQELKSDNHLQNLREELELIRQNKHETIIQFGKRVKELKRKIEEGLGPELTADARQINNKMAIRGFIDGLSSDHYKSLAIQAARQTLEETISYILHQEAYANRISMIKSDGNRYSDSKNICSFCHLPNHVEENCKKKKRLSDELRIGRSGNDINS